MSQRPRLGPVLLLALTVLTPAVAQVDQPRSPYSLAIIRGDGVLVPFASWTGERWENAWPVPESRADVPITTADIPKRWWKPLPGPVEEWHVWQVDGKRTTALVKRPSWYLAHCQQGIGLATNLDVRQPIPPPVVQPYPKIGVASTRPAAFSPIGIMSPESPVWQAIPDALGDRMDREETRQAAGWTISGWQPASKSERERVPLEVESLYRTPLGNGRFVYFFEAVKRYTRLATPPESERRALTRPSDAGPGCSMVTFVNGWFVAGNTDAQVTIPAFDVRLTTCDFAHVDVMLPIAYSSTESGPVWLVQFSGWGRERFTLMRWDVGTGSPDILHIAPGGECRLAR